MSEWVEGSPETTLPGADEVRQLAALERQHQHLTEAIQQLKTRILSLHEPGDTVYVDGEPMWKVATRRTFNETKAALVIPQHLLPLVTTQKVDPAKVKKVSTELWESCCHEGDPFLTRSRR